MSNRNRHDRAIRPSDLERTDAPPLEDRAPAETTEPAAAAEDEEETSPEPSRADLLEQAKGLQPAEPVHWLSEWESGRDAAVATAARNKEAGSIAPPKDVGCNDCWLKGRDAVVALIAG